MLYMRRSFSWSFCFPGKITMNTNSLHISSSFELKEANQKRFGLFPWIYGANQMHMNNQGKWLPMALGIVWLSYNFGLVFFFLRFYLFVGRGEGRETKVDVQEKHLSVAPRTHPTENLACNPGMCPDWESNWWPFSLQAGAQSTEPQQPGPILVFKPPNYWDFDHIFLQTALSSHKF